MRTLRRALPLGSIGVIAIACLYFWLFREPPDTVLRWQDAKADITFRVTERQGALVHTYTHLHVTKGGQTQSEQLDDDAYFGTAALVRWGDWLLVLNDNYVMGGYQYSTGKLYGEYDWDKLPFTVRSRDGDVVGRKRLRDSGATPVNFPEIPEPIPPASSEPVQDTSLPAGGDIPMGPK